MCVYILTYLCTIYMYVFIYVKWKALVLRSDVWWKTEFLNFGNAERYVSGRLTVSSDKSGPNCSLRCTPLFPPHPSLLYRDPARLMWVLVKTPAEGWVASEPCLKFRKQKPAVKSLISSILAGFSRRNHVELSVLIRPMVTLFVSVCRGPDYFSSCPAHGETDFNLHKSALIGWCVSLVLNVNYWAAKLRLKCWQL